MRGRILAALGRWAARFRRPLPGLFAMLIDEAVISQASGVCPSRPLVCGRRAVVTYPDPLAQRCRVGRSRSAVLEPYGRRFESLDALPAALAHG
jgi:hypothetical protein